MNTLCTSSEDQRKHLAMARLLIRMCLSMQPMLIVILLADYAMPAEISPAPSPETGGDSPSLQSPAHAGYPSIVFPSPEIDSSPAPRPTVPGGSRDSSSPSPSHAPLLSNSSGGKTVAGQSSRKDDSRSSSGELRGGQKAGIVVGVVIGVCVVGLGGLVYKKRNENIHRTQYSGYIPY